MELVNLCIGIKGATVVRFYKLSVVLVALLTGRMDCCPAGHLERALNLMLGLGNAAYIAKNMCMLNDCDVLTFTKPTSMAIIILHV